MAGWMIFRAFPFNIIALVVFYICVLANLKRAPFDLPECESELVSGFLTEYSGMRWGLFFLGEYAAMFALSGVTATLFMGGWRGPLHALIGGEPGSVSSMIGGALEFSWKTILFLLLMIIVRWTVPRLRLDQVMVTCYKYLVPIIMICMAMCALSAVLS
jgi:NADH-quinone oxidoreductase subunit H